MTTLKSLGLSVHMAKILLAQIIHETGFFTSRAYLQFNNVAGIVYINHSLQSGKGGTETGGNNGFAYASYKHPNDSIKHLLIVIKNARYKLTLSDTLTPAAYALALRTGGFYAAPLSAYSNAIQKYYKLFST